MLDYNFYRYIFAAQLFNSTNIKLMKKAILLFVCAASLAVVSHAQDVRFGAKGSLVLSTFSGEDAEMKVGFNLGALVQIPVAEQFMIQPELVYSAQGAKAEDDDSKLALGYINVPVLAKYQSTSGFFAETGPQVGFLLSAKAKEDGDSQDVKDQLKKVDFSWGFGIGYQTASNLGINARYNLGLSTLPDEGDAKVKNSVFQIGVFYLFGEK
jgi:opacity protein-like surface antigen